METKYERNILWYEEVCGCQYHVEVQKIGSVVHKAFAELKRACADHKDILFEQVNIDLETVAYIERRAHLTVQEQINHDVVKPHDLDQVRLYLSDVQAKWVSPCMVRTMYPLPGESPETFRKRIVERYRPIMGQIEVIGIDSIQAAR